MSFSRLLRLAACVLFCTGVVIAGPVSLVSGYAGAYLTGPGYTLSYTLPFTESYSGSQTQPAFGGTIDYAYQEQSFGDVTYATLKMNGNETAPFGQAAFFFTAADSFSGANLSVQSSVYLAESVTLNYSYSSQGPGFFAGAQEYLEFQDTHGNTLASCNFGIVVPEPSPGSATCSTAKLLVGAGTEIAINSSLSAQIGVGLYPSSPDDASFSGTATLGALDIYDLSGNLIESIDLNSLVSAPEPTETTLFGMGVLGLALIARRYCSRNN